MLKFIFIILTMKPINILVTICEKDCHQHFCRQHSLSTTGRRLLYQVQTYFSFPSFASRHSFWNMQQLPCPSSYTKRGISQNYNLPIAYYTYVYAFLVNWSMITGRKACMIIWMICFIFHFSHTGCMFEEITRLEIINIQMLFIISEK